MMRHWLTLFMTAAALCFSRPSLAASESDWADCKSQDDSARERIIAACGRIASDKKTPPKDRAIALNNRGNAYQGKQEFSRAISDYSAALKLNPTLALVYLNRAFAYKDMGEYDRALADANHAREMDPGSAVISRGRGDVYKARGRKDKGDLDNAIADYDEAIRLDPQDPINYRNRGLAFEGKGDSEHATNDYNKAMELRGR
jgi:tetratricopeptide (TPR) repeat protein